MIRKFNLPDPRGRYGDFGGRFVPETVMPAVLELESAYEEAINDASFTSELSRLLDSFAGRATPLYLSLIHISEPTRPY